MESIVGGILGLFLGSAITAFWLGIMVDAKFYELEEELAKSNTDKEYWQKEALKWANQLGNDKILTTGLEYVLKKEVERIEGGKD